MSKNEGVYPTQHFSQTKYSELTLHHKILFKVIWTICNLAFSSLAGYRFFKCSLFLLGFLHATFVTYVISINHADLPMWGIVAVSAAVGVFCGLLTMFCSYCGLFLAGLGLGFFIGVAIFFVISTFYHVTLVWIPFGVLLGLSLIFSLLTLRWQKGFFIVATSLIGAALITGGVDYFTEEFVLLNYTRQHIMAGDVQVECWVTWIILAIWPVMFILGNVVQFCKTGRSFSHKKSEFKVITRNYFLMETNKDLLSKNPSVTRDLISNFPFDSHAFGRQINRRIYQSIKSGSKVGLLISVEDTVDVKQ